MKNSVPIEDKSAPQDSVRLVCVIAEKGTAGDIMELIRKGGAKVNFLCAGIGTTSDKLMALLGLGDVNKDVVFALVEASRVENILKELKELDLSGIVFTTKLSSVGGRNTLKLLKGEI